jgi:hypothetical protein
MTIKYFSFLILVLVISAADDNFSQREEELFSRDSVYRFQGIIPPVEFQYDLNKIFSKPISNQIPQEVLFDDNPSTVWLRTQLFISNNAEQFGYDEINTHFTSPLYQQYLKDSEFDMFRYVLGIAQASAVGYMAYRHIKKYGFWK